jgi:CHASE1-domain containing sensor protein
MMKKGKKMQKEITLTLDNAEVSAILGLLYNYVRSSDFANLSSDEQDLLAELEDKFADAENEMFPV